jgi:hypothetical protein
LIQRPEVPSAIRIASSSALRIAGSSDSSPIFIDTSLVSAWQPNGPAMP